MLCCKVWTSLTPSGSARGKRTTHVVIDDEDDADGLPDDGADQEDGRTEPPSLTQAAEVQAATRTLPAGRGGRGGASRGRRGGK